MIKQKNQLLYTSEEVDTLLKDVTVRVHNIEKALEDSLIRERGNDQLGSFIELVKDLAWQIKQVQEYKPWYIKLYNNVKNFIRTRVLRITRSSK